MSWIRVVRLCEKFWVVSCVVLFLSSSTWAQTTVDQYLPLIEDYQFEKLTEISAIPGETEIGPFSPTLLQEYILLSYSRWAVQLKAGSESPPLQLDVYEMQDTLGAFGIFSIWPNLFQEAFQQRLDLSVENHFSSGGLVFWRGNYFFHLSGPDPDTSATTLSELARPLIDTIPLLNLHPVTVIHLPKEGLIRESIRFYLGESSFALNGDFPAALRAELGFDKQIEITLARYRDNGHELFLVGYPTTALAADHFVRLQNALEGYFSDEGVYMKRAGPIVSIFFGPEARALEVLAELRYLPSIKWLYQKDKDAEEMRQTITSFLDLLRETALVMVFFASISIALGVTAGFARIEILRRFPQILRRGDPILLKLDTTENQEFKE